MSVLISLIIALLLDYWLGEPKRWHPLVGFGNTAVVVEKFTRCASQNAAITKLIGLLAWCIVVLPWVALAMWSPHFLTTLPLWVATTVAGLVLYLAIGWQSLLQHAHAIVQPLAQGNIVAARQALSMIVSRDTHDLDATAIATATTESVLENGADAIFAALFWFMVGGIAGVVLYRLSNTLDAMWGYKNDQYRHFGWAAARIDDVLNFVPARLTALSYTLVGCWYGNGGQAWRSWRQQGNAWKSPNAGPVMAAGAGALGVQLGGSATYHGLTQTRPVLGEGPVAGGQPTHATITAATKLVGWSLALWVSIITLGALVLGFGHDVHH